MVEMCADLASNSTTSDAAEALRKAVAALSNADLHAQLRDRESEICALIPWAVLEDSENGKVYVEVLRGLQPQKADDQDIFADPRFRDLSLLKSLTQELQRELKDVEITSLDMQTLESLVPRVNEILLRKDNIDMGQLQAEMSKFFSNVSDLEELKGILPA
jgi:hypothetical protein